MDVIVISKYPLLVEFRHALLVIGITLATVLIYQGNEVRPMALT